MENLQREGKVFSKEQNGALVKLDSPSDERTRKNVDPFFFFKIEGEMEDGLGLKNGNLFLGSAMRFHM